ISFNIIKEFIILVKNIEKLKKA
ncbi:hypothetical protein FPSE_11280, partial [Fusarium pseudograminearum CS3096]